MSKEVLMYKNRRVVRQFLQGQAFIGRGAAVIRGAVILRELHHKFRRDIFPRVDRAKDQDIALCAFLPDPQAQELSSVNCLAQVPELRFFRIAVRDRLHS